MEISVIIPTYNGATYLPKLLNALKHQTITFELIIIDSSSTDDTISLVTPYAQKVLTIPQIDFDHGGTRTKAAQQAKGEIIVFLTQDALPVNNMALERLVSVFKDKQIGAAYGRQIPYDDTNLFGKHLRTFNYPSRSHIRVLDDKQHYGIKTTFLSDSFSAYRKSAMSEVDWFKDGLIVGEDAHIVVKLLLAEYKVAYEAQAVVYHSHSYTLVEDFGRYFDTGVFHTMEGWIVETFGKVEGEGMRYLHSELSYILSEKQYLRIPEFVLRNGLKYIGYKLGQNYQNLPYTLVRRLSMHKSWWDKTHREKHDN